MNNNSKEIKIYSNADVERIIGFIPSGHLHARFIIELSDQIIVLQEASVAAITRAYVDIITHPERKTVELVKECRNKSSWKPLYANCQLIESKRSESEILQEAGRLYERYTSNHELK